MGNKARKRGTGGYRRELRGPDRIDLTAVNCQLQSKCGSFVNTCTWFSQHTPRACTGAARGQLQKLKMLQKWGGLASGVVLERQLQKGRESKDQQKEGS